MWSHVPRFRLGKALYSNPYYSLLAIAGASLGYSTVFYGMERFADVGLKDSDESRPAYFECENEFAIRWKDYSGSLLLSPLVAWTKDQIMIEDLKQGIEFYSCEKKPKSWCGFCWSCAEAWWIATNAGLKPPFKKRV